MGTRGRIMILLGIGISGVAAALLCSRGTELSLPTDPGGGETLRLKQVDPRWIEELSEPALVEFRKPLDSKSSPNQPQDSVLVSKIQTLGPLSAESVRTNIQALEHASRAFLIKAQSVMDEHLELTGVEAWEKFAKTVEYQMSVELWSAGIALIREGSYLTSEKDLPDRFLPDNYRAIWASGNLPSGEEVSVMIPIPLERFSALRDLVEYDKELKNITLEQHVFEFNGKPYEERKALVDHDRQILKQIGQMPKDLPERHLKVIELRRQQLLPPGLVINMNSYIARAR